MQIELKKLVVDPNLWQVLFTKHKTEVRKMTTASKTIYIYEFFNVNNSRYLKRLINSAN